MELKDYFVLIRKWAWLLAIGLVLGAGIGLLVSFFQSPIYQATTRILVLRAPQEKTSDLTYLSDQQLVQTYIQLITTQPVIDGASAMLGSSISQRQISVQQIRDTQAIQLTVQDGDPTRAANIANILIQVLIQQNEIIQAGRYTTTEQSIQAQISQIQSQIAQLEQEIDNVSEATVQQQIDQVQAQISVLTAEANQLQVEIQALTQAGNQPAQLSERQDRLAQVQSILNLYQKVYSDLVVLGKPVSAGDGTTRLAQMQTTLELYQQIYINLLNNLENIRLAKLQNTPNVVQIEVASVPGRPIRPQPVQNTVVAAIIGVVLMGGVAFLIEYLDDTIRTPDDIEQILNVPVLGYIGDMMNAQNQVDELHVIHEPRSPISEAFRSLRTNLEFANVDRSLRTILVTSPGPGEGKTTISINLASIIAQGGKRVLLIDADLRRPRVHSIFGVSNRVGLTSLFRGQTTIRSVMRPITGVDGLFIMTSGNLPPNPTELLASERMNQILEDAIQEVDVVIIDSPPSLVADFQVLATKVDGAFLVIQPGYTHADIALATLERFKRVNTFPVGVILNKIPKESSHYGGYYNYQPYKQRAEQYLPNEPQPQIPASEERLNFLPAPSRRDAYIDAEFGQEQYGVEQDRYSELQRVRTSRQTDVPASANVITQPRKRVGNTEPVIIEPAKKKAPDTKKPQINTWYFGQDEDE